MLPNYLKKAFHIDAKLIDLNEQINFVVKLYTIYFPIKIAFYITNNNADNIQNILTGQRVQHTVSTRIEYSPRTEIEKCGNVHTISFRKT